MKYKAVRIKSLSQQLRWQLGLLGLGLFLASLTLLSYFSLNAIKATTETLSKLQAESIVSKAKHNSDAPLPASDTESSYRNWTDIPEPVRSLFSNGNKAPESRGEMLEAIKVSDNGEPQHFYLLHHVDETKSAGR